MQRRKVIKGIALSMGSLVSLPAWATSWNAATIGKQFFSSINNEALLAELVDTIIPSTDSPGAKSMNVHQFVQKMVTDCYDKKSQANFEKNLSGIDPLCNTNFSKNFIDCDSKQRLSILKMLSSSADSDTVNFYKTLRRLTIQGYTSSEYYLTHFSDYEMAPARYFGCVPVKKP